MSVSQADATSASTQSFVAALVLNVAIGGVEIAAWFVLRPYLRAIYEPRTYVPVKDRQAAVLSNNLVTGLWKILRADPSDILAKNGVDGYVFVRFFRLMAVLFLPIWILSWIILLPIDAAKTGVDGKDALDRFTFGNVGKRHQSRYWAHLILAYGFSFWSIYLFRREMRVWLTIRQRHLVDPEHSKLAQARTVLFTGVPKSYLDEDKLKQLFSHLPGGIEQVWLNRHLKEMPGLHDARLQASAKLESAEVDMIKLAYKTKKQREAVFEKYTKKNKPVPKVLSGPINPQLLSAENGMADPKSLHLADQLVPRKKRPTMRLKPSWAPFGLGWLGIGQKVDTIDWARAEIARTTEELDKARIQLEKDINMPGVGDDEVYPPLNSAFILFNQQIAAHMAAQSLTHHEPYRMAGRHIEMAPANVIWSNLGLNPYEANVRRAISYAITVGMIILWAFPVAFVGLVSNVSTLCNKYTWLAWVCELPNVVQGIIQGVLPPILLALLMMILPMLLRMLASFEGIPSRTGVELSLMTRYFLFLVIHTFLIVTLASGLISSIKPIAENPASVATILATQLPMASTFFLTYIFLQFAGLAGNLLQIVPLVIYYVKIILLGGSPRSIYSSKFSLRTPDWGTMFPSATIIGVIVMSYSIISPVINGFGMAYFVFGYFTWKYLFIWVMDQPAESDTGGSFFPKAINHLFVALYIQEICLCALFFLARDINGKAKSIPQGALMIVLIAFTAANHYVLNNSYGPLVQSLPISLAHLSYGMPKEEGHEGSQIGVDEDVLAPGHTNSSKEHLTPTSPGERPSHDDSTPSTEAGHARITTIKSVAPDSRDTVEMSNISEKRERQQAEEAQAEDEAKTEADFAKPGGRGARRAKHDDGADPKAFLHPATKDPQRILWLPRDGLGLADVQVADNAAAGVESTTRNAIFTTDGKIEISSFPPNEF